MDRRREVGQFGEQLAAAHLESKGYRILERNWRCRTGEIDLIADDQGTLVFIEVRTRRATGRFGSAKESIDYRKQNKVRSSAQVYAYQQRMLHQSIRFDVVTVELTLDQQLIRLEHLIAVF